MNEQLFQIICQQIQSINELTAALKESSFSKREVFALTQKLTFDSAGVQKLAANNSRQGFIAVNGTSSEIYGVASQEDATDDYFTWHIAKDGSEYYIPANNPYRGEVNFYAPTTGFVMVTEFSYQQ